MDVCLMIEGQEGVSWEQWVSLALGCEEHGFEGLFRSDHYLSFSRPAELGSLDAWATLAALAPQTSRIRLGTLFSPSTFRHPSERPKPVQDPHPTLIIGGHAGKRSLRMAAQWADEYNVFGQTPEECRKIGEALLSACEAIDRDPVELPLSLMTFTMVAEDEGALESKAERLLRRRGESGDPAAWLASLGPERLRGTPDQILEHLARYAEAGVNRIMMQHLLHEDLEALALIGKEIIPGASDL